VSESVADVDWEARARAAEARVEELARERARLWEELHQLRAERRAVEYYETLAKQMQGSISWRATRPLRDGKALVGKVRARLADRR
jgi:hypothetical protein